MSDQPPAPPDASDAPRRPGRSSAVRAIGGARGIHTPEGIERLERVDVGGDRQWISIRGRNRANPVLLVIHGGPGTPTMPLAWAFQNPWEDFFTVVQWDQRGVGRSAAGADREALRPTMTIERILADGAAVVEHLCRTLGKSRIALLGYSWGALVGVKLAERLPHRVSVYAGTGQAISSQFEPLIRAETRAAAERAGDLEAVAELDALDLSPRADGSLAVAQVQALRRISRRYDGMWMGHDTLDVMLDLAELAPEYDEADVAAFRAGSGWLVQTPLMRDLAQTDLRSVKSLQVPVVLLQGRHDLATPHAAAAAWLETLHAPHKQLVTFERSAHFAMLEEPGRFLLALVQQVLPLTEGAPAFEPRLRGA